MDGPVLSMPKSVDGLVVLVVDGHRLVAESLARLLPQLDVVGAADFATSPSRARQALQRTSVDVVLSDETIDGEPLVEMLRRCCPDGGRPALVVFAEVSDPHRTVQALRNGVAAWVARDCGLDELGEALSAAKDGHLWVSPPLRSGLIELLVEEGRADPSGGAGSFLSPRQLEVLGCLMDGMSHGEVAQELQLSLSTVRTHVQHMCRLAGVHSTPALVAAARHGHLSPQGVAHRPR